MNPFDTIVTMQHSAISTSVQHIQLSHWLQATIEPKTARACRARDLVLMIRKESDKARQKNLKKQLPGVAVGCKIRNGFRRLPENIESITGWMQFDIDPDNNTHVDDWAGLRDMLSGLAYVAFIGLSVRARGVWGLIKIKQPEEIKNHFTQFQQDLQKNYGLTLDSSKGGNHTDLRYYSYDPDAIVKSQFRIYDRLPVYSTRHVIKQQPGNTGTDVFQFAQNFVVKRWDKPGAAFTQGNMHWSIYQLCCVLNRKGVPIEDAKSYISSHIMPLENITSNCINHPYQRFENEFGMWRDAS
jgi:hypothetical protein